VTAGRDQSSHDVEDRPSTARVRVVRDKRLLVLQRDRRDPEVVLRDQAPCSVKRGLHCTVAQGCFRVTAQHDVVGRSLLDTRQVLGRSPRLERSLAQVPDHDTRHIDLICGHQMSMDCHVTGKKSDDHIGIEQAAASQLGPPPRSHSRLPGASGARHLAALCRRTSPVAGPERHAGRRRPTRA